VRSRAAFAVFATIAVFASACADAPKPLAAPQIPVAAVPNSVEIDGTALTMQLSSPADVRRAFRSVGATSLVEDGRVWELRHGDRLVGLLQLATIGRRADTRKASDRRDMRRQILVGEPTELDFSGVPVYQTTDGALNVFVWFGRQLLGTLTLKGVDAEAVSNELVTQILQDESWPNLPPDAFVEE
jgi:hypothetical protein